MSDPMVLALAYATRGVHAFPIGIAWDEGKGKTNKRPLTKRGFQDATLDPAELATQFVAARDRLGRLADGTPVEGEVLAVGLCPGPSGRVVVDLDVSATVDGIAVWVDLCAESNYPDEGPRVTTASGGTHVWFAKPAGAQFGNAHDLGEGIDVRADGGYVVAPGTDTPWGAWQWDGDDPLETGVVFPEAPPFLADRLHPPGTTSGPAQPVELDAIDNPANRAAVEALAALGGHNLCRVENRRPNGATVTTYTMTRPGKHAGLSASVGYIGPGVAKVFTSAWPNLPEGRYDADRLRVLAGLGPEDGEWLANAHRMNAPPGAQAPPAAATRPRKTRSAEERTAPLADGHRATDAGNAGRFAAAANGQARYCAKWKTWLVYIHGVWVLDTDGALVTELAKEVPRAMFRQAVDASREDRAELFAWAMRSESAVAIAAMVRLARGMDGLLVDHEDLDRHPWLLNCANGTVDLRTGELLAHDPAHLLTVQTPVQFDAAAQAPLWDDCLAVWQPDAGQRDYLQRIAGSAATGAAIEEIFFNIGGGGNGKSKFWGAIQQVLGPYCVNPDRSLLVVQNHQPHPTVKAALFGSRLVLAPEQIEAGDRLAEASMKELTGGDRVPARRMYENQWSFDPSWTFVVHANHRPNVQGTDTAIWRRIRMIEWNVTVATTVAEVIDGNVLKARLAAEARGILNWIIAGAQMYADRAEAAGRRGDGYGYLPRGTGHLRPVRGRLLHRRPRPGR